MIDITTKNPYQNRTGAYLAQPLISKLHYDTRVVVCKFRLMWGLYDMDYVLAKRLKTYPDHKKLFVLLNLSEDTKKAMKTIRRDAYFYDAYPVDLNVKTLVMVVFKLPKVIQKAFNKFMEGKFSEMYPPNMLYEFGIYHNSRVHTVLTKNYNDKEYLDIYLKRILDTFGVTKDAVVDEELDSHFISPTIEAFNVNHTGLPRSN